jgi:V/A-type H+-transporting ATPase subunit D
VLEERERRLAAELRTTTQRVNLFEKVKIPEARQALRKIRIALGDLQAAEVVRGKMAKARSRARAESQSQAHLQDEAQARAQERRA